MNLSTIIVVGRLDQKSPSLQHIQSLGHVALRQAKEVPYGQRVIAEDVCARNVPERRHMDRLEPFFCRSASNFAAQ